MKFAISSFSVLALLSLSAMAAPTPKPYAKATLTAKSGSHVSGTVEFIHLAKGILVQAHIEGATPGLHGIHVHEFGDCKAADAGSAGGHFNPLKQEHGGPGSGGHHAGDLGNIEVGADGKGTLSLNLPSATPGDEKATNQFLGKSVVIHEKADDLSTQPAGDSGARIACGTIRNAKLSIP